MSVLFQPLSLRSDLDWLTSLSLMVEAIHITSAAGQPEPALYAKVRDAIVMLDAGAIENAASIWRDILVFSGLMTPARSCEICRGQSIFSCFLRTSASELFQLCALKCRASYQLFFSKMGLEIGR